MKFILTFFATSLFLGSALFGLIMAVDPYNKFGNNLFGFETKAVDFARENKFNQIEHAKKDYTGVIMGSSSAHRYLTQELNRLTGLVFYNYSTQSATPEDYVSMTRHFLTKFKPKLVLISLDFEVLNKNTKTSDLFYSSPLKKFLKEVPQEQLKAEYFNDTYLTLEAIRDSFKVIWVNLFSKALHAYLDDGDHIVEPMPKELKVTQFDDREYTFDPQRISYLKTILKLGQEHGFRVIFFTSPLAFNHLELIYANPHLKAKHDEFKQVILDELGDFYDFQNKAILPYSSLKYFRDGNHPTHDFSTIVLERIFGKEDSANPEFGKLIKK